MEKKNPQITKEDIEKVLNDISLNKKPKERRIKFHIYFGSFEEAEKWFETFNEILKEENEKRNNN